MLTMPLWNIRNKLCEAATKFSLARNVKKLKNVTSSDDVMETRGSKIGYY